MVSVMLMKIQTLVAILLSMEVLQTQNPSASSVKY
jgi:hypothetical protein